MLKLSCLALTGLLTLCGCSKKEDAAPVRTSAASQPAAVPPGAVTIYGNPRAPRMTPEQIAKARHDTNWRRFVQLDSVAPDTVPNPEKFDSISPRSVNTGVMHLGLHGDDAGPSVLRVQIALDRSLFSPGVMDGMWGDNAEEALYWFQKSEGLPATGRVDSVTFARLMQRAGRPSEFIVKHTLTSEDVSGPFVTLPDDIYEEAKLDCMCYESLSEKLAELFHTTEDVLEKLNPGVALDSVQAGETLFVPITRDPQAGRDAEVAQLVVSGEGHYVNALDGSGKVLFHFPSTLGASYSPSPSGKFHVTSITPDPKWYYQPALLTGVPDDEEPAMIPPGPNNPVGVVWMALSAPHYGIHGTSAPETIGYATSHGCIRLTNWDAHFLSQRIDAGIPVHFRDILGAKDDTGSGD